VSHTLAQLRASAQQRANQENKTLVSTSEWNEYVNLAISELYDLIVATNPHFYVSSSAFTLSSSNLFDLTTLSPVFYKMRGVDNTTGGSSQPVSVRPLNFQERNRYQPINYQGTYVIWYTPVPPVLVADGDTLDIILDVWSEFITVHAAIAGAIKEESAALATNLSTVLRGTDGNGGIVGRINKAASNRDGEAGQAADLMFGAGYAYPWAGGGAFRYMLEGTKLTLLGTDAMLWG